MGELHIDVDTVFSAFGGGVDTSPAEATLMHFNYLHGSRIDELLEGDVRYLTVLTLDREKRANNDGALSVSVDSRGWRKCTV